MKCISMSWFPRSSILRADMDVSKTDVQKIIKYFDDAAKVYDTLPGQRNNFRAWVIRQMIKKLEKKLSLLIQSNNEEK